MELYTVCVCVCVCVYVCVYLLLCVLCVLLGAYVFTFWQVSVCLCVCTHVLGKECVGEVHETTDNILIIHFRIFLPQ